MTTKRRNPTKVIGGFLIIGFMTILSFVNLITGSDNCRDNDLWYGSSLINLMLTTYLLSNHLCGKRTVSTKEGQSVLWNYFLYVMIIATAGIPFSIARFDCDTDSKISFWQWGLLGEVILAFASLIIEIKGMA